MGEEGEGAGTARVGDLISISPGPPVVSLSQLERVRAGLAAGDERAEELASLLGGYSLAGPETRAAFEAMARSLGRSEQRGDAFLVSGVYGSGKSHLVAALTLLAGHPEQAWPFFLAEHPGYDRVAAGFSRPRLVVAMALDEYPAQTHLPTRPEQAPGAVPLEHVVLSRIEAELARGHGVRVALTEESHLLDLVARYVVPQVGADLDRGSQEAHGQGWLELRERAPATAAQVALEFLESTGFPLNWRRSRAEAWGALRAALDQHGIDGPVVVLDELGLFLAGKDRRGLNADASFLQYLAQRTSGERCWLICVIQRGLEEVGDIDRRTLRQLRDRFRPGFALSAANLGWVVEHKLVRRRDPATFAEAMRKLYAECAAAGDVPFSADELARSYPLNPLCLEALQGAAESCLSQTRSAVMLLQEAVRERGWLEQPASRLITLDLVFDVFREQLALSGAGRRHLHAHEAVMANAGRIAPDNEAQLDTVMKALCLLGVGELRWPVKLLRGSLVGGEEAELWQRPEALEEVLDGLYRRGMYVERVRREDGDEYYLDVSSEVSERIRQRLNELVGELRPGDSRVARAALEACRDDAFPLAGLAEPRSLAVEWWHARRFVTAACRDLTELGAGEVQNLVGALASPERKEDGWLFVAAPASASSSQLLTGERKGDRDREELIRGTISTQLLTGERKGDREELISRAISTQEEAWRAACGPPRRVAGWFAAGIMAWLPRELSEAEREELVEHAALTHMVGDPTIARPRDQELRARLRERWEESQARVKRLLQRVYYQGKVVAADGEEVIEGERLESLAGQWEATLAAAFAGPFQRLFPHFPLVAPERRLAGRAPTNQIIDQFIRPGEVRLPPASALEANLLAYAAPLGLVEGGEGRYRLRRPHSELLKAALAAAPARADGETIEPGEVISYSELAGRLAKGEWGLTREQGELLIAALIRAGYLVALDAFLQPTRLEMIAAPLGDNVPYLMRGAALRGATAEAARALWSAATGTASADWDLPTQERAWGELVGWAAELVAGKAERGAALARAAEAFGHMGSEWAWAEEALARAEALALAVKPGLTSRQGLARLVAEAERLPGGVSASEQALSGWRECQRFLSEYAQELARVRGLMRDERVSCPAGSLLAREHQAALREFERPAHLVSAAAEVRVLAYRWLEAYRRHYLGWHLSAHAAARFERLTRLQGSAAMEAGRRLARAGVSDEEIAAVDAALGRGLGRRCLAADPLPAGAVVCPQCGLRLGEELSLPEASELARRAAEALADQRKELRAHEGLLRRRLAGCDDERVSGAVERLVAEAELSPEEVRDLLTEDAILWVRQQLGQPQAKRRELRGLEERLRGKELTKRRVREVVEEWLGGGEDEVVEVV